MRARILQRVRHGSASAKTRRPESTAQEAQGAQAQQKRRGGMTRRSQTQCVSPSLIIVSLRCDFLTAKKEHRDALKNAQADNDEVFDVVVEDAIIDPWQQPAKRGRRQGWWQPEYAATRS